MAIFDLQAAKAAGVPDAEIKALLASRPDLVIKQAEVDSVAAREAGVPEEEISALIKRNPNIVVKEPKKETRIEHFKSALKNPAYNISGKTAAGVNVVAGGANDLIGKLISLLGKAVPETPKKVAAGLIGSTPLGFGLGNVSDMADKITPLIQKGAQKYQEFSEKNPNTSEVLNATGNVATLLPAGTGAKVAKVIKPATKVLDVLPNKYISGISGINKEILEAGATKAGRKQLKTAFGKQGELGETIRSVIKDTKLSEYTQIEEMLPKLPHIDLDRAITNLKSQKKIAPASATEASMNRAIEAQIKRWQNLKRTYGNKLAASQYKDLREALDKDIIWNPVSSAYNSETNRALQSTRKFMANELIKAAETSGNSEWKNIMKRWSSKLNILDDVRKDMGKNHEQYIKTLFSGSKDVKREHLNALGDMLGKDFVEEAKKISLANKLPDGTFQIKPKGLENILMGGGLGAAAYKLQDKPLQAMIAALLAAPSSPAIAARAYNPVTKTIGATLPVIPTVGAKLTIQDLIDSLNATQNQGQK